MKISKWSKIEICTERISIEKETEKAYLLKFRTDLDKEYKFWYPKILIDILCGSLIISYENNKELLKKVFFNKKKELNLTILELIKLLNKSILFYSDFYDNIEYIETYVPENIFKEVEIDEDLFA